jgi:tetratricopeptide (TPR) repeat protein
MDSGLQTVQRSHRSPTPPLNVRTALREERPQRTIEWRRAARSFAFASAITALVVGGGTIAFDVLGRRAPAQVAAAGPLRPALPPPAAQVPADPPAPPAVVPAAAPISLESAAKPVPAAPVPVRLPIDTEPAGAEVQPKLEPEPRPVPALGNELLEGADSGPAAARKGEGKTFYAKGRYDEAAEAFKWAHAFDPRPSLLFNIAQCFRLGGRNEDAAVYYKRYLKEEPAAKNRAAVQRTLRELRATRPAARAGTEGTGARP